MRDGTEAEVTVFVKLPGEDDPAPIAGLVIIQGMTEDQIRNGMNVAAGLVLRRLMEKGAMKYSTIANEFISFTKKLKEEEERK